jgi:polyisoprenyl-phosphate glycosyltransferase
MTGKKLISIIVPVLNEEENVERLYEAVTQVMGTLEARYDFELIFTDNHSTDSTFGTIERIAAADPRVRGFRFSKNFGFQRSILTGYMRANGDAVIQIDADLQDPPELIPLFIDKWEEGFDVVYGLRRSRQEGWLIGFCRKVFYSLIDKLSEDDLPQAAGDFRLVSRRIVDLMREVDDYHPYLRGLIASFGFDQVGIPYDRAPRTRGASKFPFFRLLALAVDGILVHSVIPLRIATFVGLFMSLVMFLGIIGYAASRIFLGHDWPPGFATTTVLLLLGIVLNGLFLGIVGEYLGRMYQQVKKRPVTIIERETPLIGGLSADEKSTAVDRATRDTSGEGLAPG